MSDEDLYRGREQTYVKHFVLQEYLRRFACIVGTFAESITYIDCFSGPWNVRSEDSMDSSFALALRALRSARGALRRQGRPLNLRCLFLEKDKAKHRQLTDFAQNVHDAEILTLNADLESSIERIVSFVDEGGRSFAFIFIDPTGWTGFKMSAIRPLLQLDPGEVLINFMTSHIKRFIESPHDQIRESFEDLFGSGTFRDRLAGMAGQDREDAAVSEYANRVKEVGAFKFACKAIVLDSERARTHFHLIYATRNAKGIEVFKDAEKRAMRVMEKARADAQQRRRTSATGQTELFAGEALYDPLHYDSLRRRYLSIARSNIVKVLRAHTRVLYDDLWWRAVAESLVWESDLKLWIREWSKDGAVTIEGLKNRESMPKRTHNHFIVCRKDQLD